MCAPPRRRSAIALLALVLVAAPAGAAAAAPPAPPPPKERPPSLAPAARARCVAPPSGVLHRTTWKAAGAELLVVAGGASLGEVRSDRVYDVRATELLLVPIAKERCVRASVALGEVTVLRAAPSTLADEAETPVTFTTLRLSGPRPEVLLVWLVRDVAWGRTEEYVVAVDVAPDRLVASPRVLARVDSLDRKGFYSEAAALEGDPSPDGAIILKRSGAPGTSPRPVILRRAPDGSFKME